jgi:hypothetical protein
VTRVSHLAWTPVHVFRAILRGFTSLGGRIVSNPSEGFRAVPDTEALWCRTIHCKRRVCGKCGNMGGVGSLTDGRLVEGTYLRKRNSNDALHTMSDQPMKRVLSVDINTAAAFNNPQLPSPTSPFALTAAVPGATYSFPMQ